MAKAMSFRVVAGTLERHVEPDSGVPYIHRCPEDSYELVAWTVEKADGPITGTEIARATGLPESQVHAALAFMRDRGVVGRRNRPASSWVTTDALIEFHALAMPQSP